MLALKQPHRKKEGTDNRSLSRFSQFIFPSVRTTPSIEWGMRLLPKKGDHPSYHPFRSDDATKKKAEDYSEGESVGSNRVAG